jgi:large subunit ribosomal protein L23
MRPLTTEKAIMILEKDNIITFVVNKKQTKEEIKKEFEDLFEFKVEKIRTLIRNNKKYAYIKLKKDFLAIDLATKLGMM